MLPLLLPAEPLLPLPLPVVPLLPLPLPDVPLLPLPLGVVVGCGRLIFVPLLLGSVGWVRVPLVPEPLGRASRAPSVMVPFVEPLVPDLPFFICSVVEPFLPLVDVVSAFLVCADAVLIANAQNAVVAKTVNFFIM